MPVITLPLGAGSSGDAPPVDAAVADDNAVWTLSLGRAPDGRDRYVVAREGTTVELATPAGAPLRPESLAFDVHLGITILARDGAVRWLLAEHAPAELVEL